MLSSHPFTPPKLSAYVDEAKTYAAEYTLQTLGIPTEGTDAPTAAAAAPTAPAFTGKVNCAGIGTLQKPSLVLWTQSRW